MINTVKRMVALLLVLSIIFVSMGSCSVFDRGADKIFSKKLSREAKWLKGLSADDVVSVDIKDRSGSRGPGSLNVCCYTEDKEVIEKIIADYQNLKITNKSGGFQIKNGGWIYYVIFTMSDGSVEKLYFNSGYYCQGSESFKVVSQNNMIDYYEMCDHYYYFECFSTEADVYANTDNPVIVGKAEKINFWAFSYIELAEIDSDVDADYYVDSEFGKIYILGESQFCYERQGKIECYELKNGHTFSDFITFFNK